MWQFLQKNTLKKKTLFLILKIILIWISIRLFSERFRWNDNKNPQKATLTSSSRSWFFKSCCTATRSCTSQIVTLLIGIFTEVWIRTLLNELITIDTSPTTHAWTSAIDIITVYCVGCHAAACLATVGTIVARVTSCDTRGIIVLTKCNKSKVFVLYNRTTF